MGREPCSPPRGGSCTSRATSPGRRAAASARIVQGMPIRSRALGVAGDRRRGRAAPATASGWRPYPVEYKRGQPKAHRADEVQLCAQALCLEEMFGRAGARGRPVLRRDAPAPRRSRSTPSCARSPARSPRRPARCSPPAARRRRSTRRKRCDACSLLELCRPKRLARPGPVAAWLRRADRGGRAARRDRRREAPPQHALRHHRGRVPEQGRRQRRGRGRGRRARPRADPHARRRGRLRPGRRSARRCSASAPRTGVAVTFLTEHGRFLARVEGPVSGNVLLRREQYRRTDDPDGCAAIVRSLVIGKALNQRAVLAPRAARPRRAHGRAGGAPRSRRPSDRLADIARRAERPQARRRAARPRGRGGATSTSASSTHLIRAPEGRTSASRGRSRRPPLDPVNALLSFLYTLLAHDCARRCETRRPRPGGRLPAPRPAGPAEPRARPDGGVPPRSSPTAWRCR